jgi:hypothetical protein
MLLADQTSQPDGLTLASFAVSLLSLGVAARSYWVARPVVRLKATSKPLAEKNWGVVVGMYNRAQAPVRVKTVRLEWMRLSWVLTDDDLLEETDDVNLASYTIAPNDGNEWLFSLDRPISDARRDISTISGREWNLDRAWPWFVLNLAFMFALLRLVPIGPFFLRYSPQPSATVQLWNDTTTTVRVKGSFRLILAVGRDLLKGSSS